MVLPNNSAPMGNSQKDKWTYNVVPVLPGSVDNTQSAFQYVLTVCDHVIQGPGSH